MVDRRKRRTGNDLAGSVIPLPVKTHPAPKPSTPSPSEGAPSSYKPRVVDKPMTAKQLANFLQVSQVTVRRYVRAGRIPYIQIGKQFRFLPGQVLTSLQTPKRRG